jgi:phosphoserine phosphatase RsbU/P
MNKPARVLTIEDEETVRQSMVAYLEDSGYEMLEAPNGRVGIDLFEQEQPDVVLCDLRMPELDGLEVLEHIAAESPETPLIIVSGTGDMRDAIQALKLGAWDYITKPIQDLAVLEHSITKALERARLLRENRQYREHLEQSNRRLQESLRQLEDDESVARRMQFQLLPIPSMTFDGYVCQHFLQTSAYLSGDFVDYFLIDDTHLGFYIADVSGHGVSSAFVTVLLKSTVGHLLDQYRQSEHDLILHPEQVLALINQDIVQQQFGKYLTMFYVVVDMQARTMTYSNGGQFPYPILHNGHEAAFLVDKNLPVGLFQEAEFHRTTAALPDRFAMALFSDGILEILPQQRLEEKEIFLKSQVSGVETSLDQLVSALGLEAIQSPLDDITLLTVNYGA